MKTASNEEAPESQLQALFDKFDPRHQKFIQSIRAALRKRFPTANELAYDYSSFFVIGYSPTENGIESIVSFSARPDRVDLYFNHGPQLPDPKKLLRGSGKQTRFIQVESARQLSQPDVEAFMAAAIDRTGVPLPTRRKGNLIIKTFKASVAKKKSRPRPKK